MCSRYVASSWPPAGARDPLTRHRSRRASDAAKLSVESRCGLHRWAGVPDGKFQGVRVPDLPTAELPHMFRTFRHHEASFALLSDLQRCQRSAGRTNHFSGLQPERYSPRFNQSRIASEMRLVGYMTKLVVLMSFAMSPTGTMGQSLKPAVNAVTNAASYANGPISPGEMVVIFGSGMGPSNLVGLQLDQQGRVANALSQVQVLFDGNPAPLIYVSAQQVAAMVPYGLAGKSATQIQVMYQGVASDPVQKSVAASAPGVFTADASGKGQAAMTNSDGSYNSLTNAAAPGSWVTFYLTGEGQTNPLGSDGNIATSTANVAFSVAVLIAGRTAQLLYAGSAPGNVNGFCQINAVVPADLQYGGNLPLVVQIGGVSSQTAVTLAVSGPPAPMPGAPQNLAASVNSSGQVVLAWTPADSLATRFHVERQIAGTAFMEIALIQASATTFTDATVTAGIAYQYRLRAENDYGFSDYSAVVNATVPIPQLLPPSNLQAVAVSQTQVNLTWSAANTNATRFHIERKSGPTGIYAEIAAVPSTTTSYQDTTVQPSTTYTYRMRSEGTPGFSAYSNESSAATPALPLPPAPTLQATTTSASQIHVSWTTTATGIIRFRLERRLTTGLYSEIAQPSATSASFDDSGLAALTTYLYRLRVETGAGISAYSNEVTVTTLALPLPPAPILQGTATSSSQVHLSWSTTATGIVLFSVERRTTTGVYSQISQPAAMSTSFDDSGLTGSTTYLYRIRVETSAGYSPYSNEVTVTTLQALPAAPTNLQATAVSSSQVNLTWTNNAPDATAIRVEYLPASSTNFADIGPAATLTSTGVPNLQPNTTYSFRVRAQNGAGYSAYSNVATVTTLPLPKTVFLIHGLNQGPSDMKNLATNLSASYGLTAGRFIIDYGFDFSGCADETLAFCTSNCTISGGAQLLAQHIVNANPPGDIVLVGFSLGGLIARDLIVNNRIILNGRKIHLVTIGTPNLGYPYLPTDSLVFCSAIVSAMYGDWRAKPNTVVLSDYLLSLTNQWSASGFPGTGRTWFAASGRACNFPTRAGEGCRDQNPYSDGVVCQDSAAYNVSTSAGTQPNYSWSDPSGSYAHSYSGLTFLLLCDTSDETRFLPLWNPPPTGTLFTTLTAILNGL